MVRCVVHDDQQASLHVAPGNEQPVVMYDHAGCRMDDILNAAGIDIQQLLNERDEAFTTGEWTPAGDASHKYQYTDEEGTLLFEVLRVPLPGGKKTFRQRHPDPQNAGRWQWNMQGVRRVLYQLPEVLQAIHDGRTIYIVEGEKDVESLRKRGEVATTSPMGAGKWRPEFADMLAGANVVIIPDGDATGRAHARTIRESLVAKECTVSIKEPMTGAKDITDHFGLGGDLTNLLETAPEVEEKRVSYGIDVLDMIERTVSETSFVVPGVLARGDRFLLTGLEGHGKSHTMRQWAAQTAAGIHIWTGEEIEPQKVLYIDAENHPDQTLEPWQDLVGLCARHDRPLERGQLTILEEWDSEIDLTSETGKEWLLERVHAYKPDLVCMGPLYTMSGRDLKDDETVRKIKSAVNEARSLYGSAIIMEHHAPHRQPGDKERSIRPYGSSTFLKFPEFGFGMKPTDQEGVYEFQKTRFPRIRKRNFPGYMRWGKKNTDEWPWMPAEMTEDGQVY